MQKVNSFTLWFDKINKKFSMQEVVLRTLILPTQVYMLLQGEVDPNIDVVLLLMYKLNLTDEEKSELIEAVAEAWDMPPKAVFDSLANHLVEMAENASKAFIDGPKLEIRS